MCMNVLFNQFEMRQSNRRKLPNQLIYIYESICLAKCSCSTSWCEYSFIPLYRVNTARTTDIIILQLELFHSVNYRIILVSSFCVAPYLPAFINGPIHCNALNGTAIAELWFRRHSISSSCPKCLASIESCRCEFGRNETFHSLVNKNTAFVHKGWTSLRTNFNIIGNIQCVRKKY